jgi:hypothetical protein
MKMTIDNNDFRREFFNRGRENQFSYEGLGILFEYLDELDSDMELDVIAICCDFSEDSAEDIQRAYSIEHDADDESNLADAVRQYLEDEGHFVGETENSFIYFNH